MLEARIAAAPLTLETGAGFSPAIDTLAERGAPGRGFLRAAWFRAGAAGRGRTLVVRRDGGEPILALPTIGCGPVPHITALLGARQVPGSYWPFRGVPMAQDTDLYELAEAFGHPAMRNLATVLRLGPVPSDDHATRLLVDAARLAGWEVLSRPAGTTWLIDCDTLREQGWPKSSTARRLRVAWRKLSARGTPDWRCVRGADWNAGVLEALGTVEKGSWIARQTDGSGAKFMHPHQRAAWRIALADPALAQRLSATILMLDRRPVAFSFDLEDGPVQYGIAGSYVEDLADCSIGKLVNYRALEDAITAGRSVMDMGAGDSGYKAAMGAVEGYDLADLLFVRSRAAARMLAGVWCKGAREPDARHG